MKKLTTLLTALLLTFLALGCNAQEPDLSSYSDSLHNAVVDSIVNYKDSVITNRDNAIDSLITLSKVFNPLIIRDSIDFIVEGQYDSLSLSVEKNREQIKIGLKNGEKIVFYVDF